MPRTVIEVVGRAGLSSTPMWELEEKAAQTFKIGAILNNSSGFVAEAGALPTNILGVAVRAGQNGTSNGDKKTKFIPALQHIIFEGSIDDATNLGNGAFVDANMLGKYGLTKDANGIWYIDKSEEGDARVVIVGISDPVSRAAADGHSSRIQARVQFLFLADDAMVFTHR